ncbi:MAG: class I SAM-dependent rRNA methyltransferase, partial [Candidatus Diapherotrites archaeon]|nr:class I SAM-dependent rRNA methyltransferase [Candidatus Diapherotrites archaeon]
MAEKKENAKQFSQGFLQSKKAFAKLFIGKSIEREIQKGTRLIYGTTIKKTKGEAKKGEIAWLVDEKGKFIAQAFYNPKNAVIAQIVSLKEKEKIDEGFLQSKILKASAFRSETLKLGTTHRMFYGEADGIPGLLIDRFNNICSVQISCPGVEIWKQKIAEILLEIQGVETVVERNDSRNRVKLGLPVMKGVIAGNKKTQTIIEEGKVKFEVDVLRGHKTGFYLDQRENRLRLAEYCSEGKEMLDVFSYTGGFGLHAAASGANVTMIDLPEALQQARRNAKLNGLEDKISFIEGNAFEQTEKLISKAEKFDIISCDPPAFVQKSEDLEKGKKAYHQINYNCFKLVKDGGILATSSCSHFLSEMEFLDLLIAAAANAGKRVSLVEKRFQSRDHLTPIASKKGNYLKCYFLRVE